MRLEPPLHEFRSHGEVVFSHVVRHLHPVIFQIPEHLSPVPPEKIQELPHDWISGIQVPDKLQYPGRRLFLMQAGDHPRNGIGILSQLLQVILCPEGHVVYQVYGASEFLQPVCIIKILEDVEQAPLPGYPDPHGSGNALHCTVVMVIMVPGEAKALQRVQHECQCCILSQLPQYGLMESSRDGILEKEPVFPLAIDAHVLLVVGEVSR